MPTAKPTAADLRAWAAKGLIRADQAAPPAEPKPELVAASFAPPATWVVPVPVPSLANERQWQARTRVAQAHRKAVSRALGPHLRHLSPFAEHFHAGGVLVITLTRLGGRALDRAANLPAALKYVEDAVALVVGADDGAPNWRCECRQEPGGPAGVRIELTTQGT